MSRFTVFPQFNEPELASMVRSRHRLGTTASEVFSGTRIQDRFVRALAERRVLNTKEVLESFAFHKRTRKRIRRPQMADLCCGHGLTGVLFALLETRVEHVTLVDSRRPDSVTAVLDAAVSLAPWMRDKVTYIEADIGDGVELPRGTAVFGVHACGAQTDRVLDVGVECGGPIAVMPCCYRKAARHGPPGIQEVLGAPMAIDIHRTYRMAAAGLRVDWAEIPSEITPMCRVMVGWQPAG